MGAPLGVERRQLLSELGKLEYNLLEAQGGLDWGRIGEIDDRISKLERKLSPTIGGAIIGTAVGLLFVTFAVLTTKLSNSLAVLGCAAMPVALLGLVLVIRSLPRLLPRIAFGLFWLPRDAFRMRTYYSAVGFVLLVLGFALQLASTFNLGS